MLQSFTVLLPQLPLRLLLLHIDVYFGASSRNIRNVKDVAHSKSCNCNVAYEMYANGAAKSTTRAANKPRHKLYRSLLALAYNLMPENETKLKWKWKRRRGWGCSWSCNCSWQAEDCRAQTADCLRNGFISDVASLSLSVSSRLTQLTASLCILWNNSKVSQASGHVCVCIWGVACCACVSSH